VAAAVQHAALFLKLLCRKTSGTLRARENEPQSGRSRRIVFAICITAGSAASSP